VTQNETPSPIQGNGHSNKNTDVTTNRFKAEESDKKEFPKGPQNQRKVIPDLPK